MDVPEIKPGAKSSEFYFTILNNAVGLSVLLGYLTPQQADDFVRAVVSVIGGLMVIASTVVYIYGRVKLKQTAVQSSKPTNSMPITEKIEGLANDTAVYPR